MTSKHLRKRDRRIRPLIVLAILAATFVVYGATPAQTQTSPTPGVAYTHVNLVDDPCPLVFGQPSPCSNHRNEEVQIDWFYPVSNTAGLAPAAFEFKDGTNNNYGQHLIPGVYAAASNTSSLIPGTNPILVFSHGSGGHGMQNETWFREMAKKGYIVAAVTHVDHSLVKIGRCNSTSCTDSFSDTHYSRHRDLKFAIGITDAVFGAYGKVKRSSPTDPYVIASGHSQGGISAILLASGLARNGTHDNAPETDATFQYNADPRVDGMIGVAPSRNLTEVSGWSAAEVQFLLATITKPVLLISGRSDLTTPIGVTEQVRRELTGTPWTEWIDVKDARHNATTDLRILNPDVQASTLPSAVKQLVSDLSGQQCNTGDTCVDRFHALQLDASLDFLDRVPFA